MRNVRGRVLPFSLILIFVLAVLVPSIALSFLALRAADRESLYVERRFERALMAEVELSADRVDEVMNGIQSALSREFTAFDLETALPPQNPLVGVSFMVDNDGLVILRAPGSEQFEQREQKMFEDVYGFFLRGDERLPVYDSVARIYRHDAVTETTPMEKNSTSRKLSSPSSGIERQRAESLIASDRAVMDEAFEQAAGEGFEISARNVAPLADAAKKTENHLLTASDAGEVSAPAAVAPVGRSQTVSRSRSFREITSESDFGLLPCISDTGLNMLFWRVLEGSETIVGCSVNMTEVRDRIADSLPNVLTEVRVLNVLDENGTPIITAGSLPEQDWRSPYVAREISPSLPRWEVGAWLLDPGALVSRARFTSLAVSVMVALLFVVIAFGGVVVIWVVSSEMRIASQKTTFAANVSHELKTPLTSIKLFAELLLSGKQADEEKRGEYLRTMVSEVDRLSRLVEDVLTFSRRGKNYPMRQVDLANIARYALLQLEPRLVKSGFDVKVESEAQLPVNGNREALIQVVTNLLSNAEKYSGEVREISMIARRDGEWAVLEVLDRGIGVEPKYVLKIFQEFFRGDDSLSSMRSGAGLGLSIARDIAHRHGGEVCYAQRKGGGSVFSLTLPIYEGGGKR
jgi:signal transduction histidine kinase